MGPLDSRRRLPAVHAFLVLLASIAGCDPGKEYAILIEAHPEEAVQSGATLTVTVRDTRSAIRAQSSVTIDRDLAPSEPMRIGIDLDGAGAWVVHLAIDEPPMAATRCYTVTGVTRSSVLLLGPAGLDGDGDTWTAAEICREVGSQEVGCESSCPPRWGEDCDDADPERNPGAEEVCDDGKDQDCDGDDPPCEDADSDLYPPCPPGARDDTTCDCDDEDPAVNPSVTEGPELCENGKDDDCTGGDLMCDDDGDGHAECKEDEQGPSCDCDDLDPTTYPGAGESPDDTCDGKDNNCNGLVDEVEGCLSDDLDGDGALATCDDPDAPVDCLTDCDDCSAAVAPGNAQVCGTPIDEACDRDGARQSEDSCAEGDEDADGVLGEAAGGSDCDDDEPRAYPGARDQCEDDVDWSCAGADTECQTDADADRYNADNDCDDENPAINPGVADGCNGIDDDCDGVVDEDVPDGFGCVNLGEWVEIDYGSELLHCGGCRRSCNAACGDVLCAADACTDGICTCADDPACSGASSDFCCPDGCRNLMDDVSSCGVCGNTCTADSCQIPVCVNGGCGTEAAPDGQECGDSAFCCHGQCIGRCAPGDELLVPCGDRCGTQTRVCGDDCAWGEPGDCEDEGACAPDEVDEGGCGNCGTRSRTCGDDCSWGGWSECEGEGPCAPGARDEEECGECGNRAQRCEDDCTWSYVSGCDNSPARSCDDGDPCTTDTCGSDGDCDYADCADGTMCCDWGCDECCDDPDCTGNPGTCNTWSCNQGKCEAVDVPDGTDPGNDCGGGTPMCCEGDCAECCDDADCTDDPPRCRYYYCDSSNDCALDYIEDGTDPNDDCGGSGGADCCDGSGGCRHAEAGENCY